MGIAHARVALWLARSASLGINIENKITNQTIALNMVIV